MGGEGMIRCRKTTGRAPPPLLILTFIKTWPFSPRGFTKQEVKCREGNWQGEKTSSKLFSCETRLRMIPPPPLPHTSQSGPRVGISPQTATNHLSWKILWSLVRGKPRRLFPAERSREGGGHRGPNPALGRWPLPRSQAAALVAGGGSARAQRGEGGKGQVRSHPRLEATPAATDPGRHAPCRKVRGNTDAGAEGRSCLSSALPLPAPYGPALACVPPAQPGQQRRLPGTRASSAATLAGRGLGRGAGTLGLAPSTTLPSSGSEYRPSGLAAAAAAPHPRPPGCSAEPWEATLELPAGWGPRSAGGPRSRYRPRQSATPPEKARYVQLISTSNG